MYSKKRTGRSEKITMKEYQVVNSLKHKRTIIIVIDWHMKLSKIRDDKIATSVYDPLNRKIR